METANKYQISEVQWPQRMFVVKRETVGFNALTDFFTRNYGGIYGQLARRGIVGKDAPYAIYYTIDEAKGVTDLAAAVPVDEPVSIEGYELLNLPAAKMITTQYIGPYEKMMDAYKALDDYLAAKGMKRSLILEQYLSDPAVDKDPNLWKTNIFMMVD